MTKRTKRTWCVHALAVAGATLLAAWPQAARAQHVSRAYLLATFDTAPGAPVTAPFTLTGRTGVQLTLDANGVAIAAQELANPISIGMDVPLLYSSNLGGIRAGKKVKTLPEHVDQALERFDDIGFVRRDLDKTVAFRKGARLVLALDRSVGALVFGEDGGLDAFRLEYSPREDFATTTVLFDGFNASTKADLLKRRHASKHEFVISDFTKQSLDQAYLFFISAPPGFLRVTETQSFGTERLKLDCAVGHAAACGDGLLDPAETCDPPGDTCTPDQPCNPCRADCTRCGDGLLQTGDQEACDPPGSLQAFGNTCRSSCTFCGDGTMQPNEGETCDPPCSGDPDSGCQVACRTDCTSCGDRVIQRQDGETCDPPCSGDPDAFCGAACRNDCTACGDGIVQGQDGETCDPGTCVPGVPCSCRFDCTRCGDGIVQRGPGHNETCDPGACVPGLPCGCRSDCTFCGDGNVDPGEECDGSDTPCDGGSCRGDCTCTGVVVVG